MKFKLINLFLYISNAFALISRIPIHGSNLSLSSIAIGALHFPEYNGNSNILIKHLEKALELNITTLDTADVYGWYTDGKGRSNDIISEAFINKPELRKKFEIVAKFGIRLQNGYHVDLSPEWIDKSINNYLQKFNTNYIDVFMIHNPPQTINNDDVARTFKNLYDAGKVLSFGVSNFHKSEYELLESAMNKYNLSLKIVELETSVLHPDKVLDGTIDYFNKKNITILGWGPLGGDPNGGKNLLFDYNTPINTKIIRTLSNIGSKYNNSSPDQIAIAWLLNQNKNIIPILGTTLNDRLFNQTYTIFDIKLTNNDISQISKSNI